MVEAKTENKPNIAAAKNIAILREAQSESDGSFDKITRW